MKIHPSAEVSQSAKIGAGTSIWHFAQVREDTEIGRDCILGKDVYVDFGVRIGNKVKIQNSALIYHGAEIEEGVFIGPQACLTNDRIPRSITPEGQLKTVDDWTEGQILLRYGASIGAGAIILPNVTIGRYAMVGAGSVVSRNVPDHSLVVGIPARHVGYVCKCGYRLARDRGGFRCPACSWMYDPEEDQT